VVTGAMRTAPLVSRARAIDRSTDFNGQTQEQAMREPRSFGGVMGLLVSLSLGTTGCGVAEEVTAPARATELDVQRVGFDDAVVRWSTEPGRIVAELRPTDPTAEAAHADVDRQTGVAQVLIGASRTEWVVDATSLASEPTMAATLLYHAWRTTLAPAATTGEVGSTTEALAAYCEARAGCSSRGGRTSYYCTVLLGTRRCYVYSRCC
jgi:hypothetical protein